MLERHDLVGHRLADILCDSSSSSEAFRDWDFMYVTDHGIGFRMPDGDPDNDDVFPAETPSPEFRPLYWPPDKQRHFQENLWSATITDILVVAKPEYRRPDTGAIALSSGRYLLEGSGGPWAEDWFPCSKRSTAWSR